jgi:hypothetical protein
MAVTLIATSSTKSDPKEAAAELAAGLGSMKPRFLLYFATPRTDPAALGKALADTFGDVPAIGCTTAGEIVTGKMLEGSVVLMAMDEGTLASVATAVVDDVADDASVDRAMEALAEQVGSPLAQIDPSKYVGLVLHDGLSLGEERVMARIGDLANVPFVGGSAGDDVKFVATHVFHGFEPRRGASVLALLEPARPYHILKTQSFRVLDKTLTVTDVDEATRTVRAFDGKPAAQAYAEALGVTVEDLPNHFQAHPVGLVLEEDDPFVRSPQQIKGTDVVFYCQIKKGMTLHVLEARNIVEETGRDLEQALAAAGSCTGIINFHCILRTLELKQRGQMEAYGQLFTKVPTVGFSTYGESYVGNINQTSTMVLFT